MKSTCLDMSKTYLAESVAKNLDHDGINIYGSKDCAYTTDRYALYLQGKIGDGTEFLNKNLKQELEIYEKNQQIEDVWVQLYKFIYVKSIALAQKSDGDVYLKVGEFWLVLILAQLVASVMFVSGPSIYKFFYLRLIYYIIVYLFYLPFLNWVLLNTRLEHVQKPYTGLMRILFIVLDLAMIIFVFVKCPSFDSQLITFILFNCYIPLLLYIENLVATDQNFLLRVKNALGQHSGALDGLSSVLFLVRLSLVFKNATFYVFLVVLIIASISEIVEIFASKNFPQYRVRLIIFVIVLKFLKLVLLLSILTTLIERGNSTGGFGLVQLMSSNINLLLLVYRMCQVSTENLVEKINRLQSE